MALLRKGLQGACVVCALGLHGGYAAAEPENGWWWNPNESGRGFFIETTSGVIYLAGYFYDVDGRATWLSSGGPNPDPYAYAGRLQSYHNGQTLFGPYHPPDAGVDAGPVQLVFSDDTHGTLSWAGGTIPIERQTYGVAEEEPVELWAIDLFDPPFSAETGWWWNDSESGRGYSVEVQGSNVFVASFMYDEAGNPIWYYSAGPMATPTHYEGDVLEFFGGQTMTGPYRPPAGSRTIGRMTMDFAATDDATITVTDGAIGKTIASGVAPKRSTGRRQRPQLPRYIFTREDQWPHWNGPLNKTFHEVSEAGTTGTFTSDEKFAYDLKWIRIGDTHKQALAQYALLSASRLNYTRSTFDTSNGCAQTADETYGGLEGRLTIRWNLTYAGWVKMPGSAPVDVHEKCDDGMGNVSSSERIDSLTEVLAEFGGAGRHVQNMSSIRLATPSTVPPKISSVKLLVGGIQRWDFTAGQ